MMNISNSIPPPGRSYLVCFVRSVLAFTDDDPKVTFFNSIITTVQAIFWYAWYDAYMAFTDDPKMIFSNSSNPSYEAYQI